jgi:single-strand DNA-binding protein
VTKVSLATTSVRKDREGNTQERTEWHRVTCFGKTRRNRRRIPAKGSQVYVEGSIRVRQYTGQDGTERYSTDIIADEMQMLGGRAEAVVRWWTGEPGAGTQRAPSRAPHVRNRAPRREAAPAKSNDFATILPTTISRSDGAAWLSCIELSAYGGVVECSLGL